MSDSRTASGRPETDTLAAQERRFAQALARCLDEVGTGRFGVAEAAARYAQTEELVALLELAETLRAVPLPPRREPTPVAEVLRRATERRRARWSPLPLLRPWHRAPAVRAAAALMSLLLFWATLAPAASAMPGEPLYPFKRLREQVELVAAIGEVARVERLAAQFEARVEEAESEFLDTRTRLSLLAEAAVNVQRAIETASQAQGPASDRVEAIVERLQSQEIVIVVPPEATPPQGVTVGGVSLIVAEPAPDPADGEPLRLQVRMAPALPKTVSPTVVKSAQGLAPVAGRADRTDGTTPSPATPTTSVAARATPTAAVARTATAKPLAATSSGDTDPSPGGAAERSSDATPSPANERGQRSGPRRADRGDQRPARPTAAEQARASAEDRLEGEQERLDDRLLQAQAVLRALSPDPGGSESKRLPTPEAVEKRRAPAEEAARGAAPEEDSGDHEPQRGQGIERPWSPVGGAERAEPGTAREERRQGADERVEQRSSSMARPDAAAQSGPAESRPTPAEKKVEPAAGNKHDQPSAGAASGARQLDKAETGQRSEQNRPGEAPRERPSSDRASPAAEALQRLRPTQAEARQREAETRDRAEAKRRDAEAARGASQERSAPTERRRGDAEGHGRIR